LIDGAYRSKLGNLVLARADTDVWLDLPRRVWLPRLLRRTIRRLLMQEQLWNGNRETLRGVLWAPDALIPIAWRSFAARRHRYPTDLASQRWSGCAAAGPSPSSSPRPGATRSRRWSTPRDACPHRHRNHLIGTVGPVASDESLELVVELPGPLTRQPRTREAVSRVEGLDVVLDRLAVGHR
jgi:hypothetical protein